MLKLLAELYGKVKVERTPSLSESEEMQSVVACVMVKSLHFTALMTVPEPKSHLIPALSE